MATRRELIAAVGARYREASRSEKKANLDELVAVTGYHRKHAVRLLRCELEKPPAPRPRRCVYDEAVRQALTILWEAADRVCGKRLKALLPTLIEAMQRHGHLARIFHEPRTGWRCSSNCAVCRHGIGFIGGIQPRWRADQADQDADSPSPSWDAGRFGVKATLNKQPISSRWRLEVRRDCAW
jgi:hypothetical protein